MRAKSRRRAMRRLRICILFLIVVLLGMALSPLQAAATGIDRTRIRARLTRGRGYTVTLAIGGMTFNGTLMRGDKLTDEDIENAIANVLERTNGLTEQQIGEWSQWSKDMILHLYATAPSPYEPIQQFR